MNFSDALQLIKVGKRLSRTGWNGNTKSKSMFVVYIKATVDTRISEIAKTDSILPWIGMHTKESAFVPWIASQSDLLADDWEIKI